jgi:hypothetical protein
MDSFLKPIRMAHHRLRQQLPTLRPNRLLPADPSLRDIWSIAIYSGESPFKLAPVTGIKNPAITAHDVTDVRADFVADPFMIQRNKKWFMFFEVLNHDTQRGQIAVANSEDGYTWTYQNIVLDEPFHLSYPYVFEWNEEYFMIPETHQAKAVRLYKTIDFPNRWKLVKTLIHDVEFADASPFFHQHRWWLFAGAGENWHSSELLLYQSKNLMGPWTEHPKSPILTRRSDISRPSGRVLTHDGKIFRLTQNCQPLYGTSVKAFEITELTEASYRERPLQRNPILKAPKRGWNSVGMHHIDAHRLPYGTWLACVDGWTWGPH